MVSFMALVYFFILHSQLPAWQPECCSVAAESCMSFKIGFKVNLFKFWLQNWENRQGGKGIRGIQHHQSSTRRQTQTRFRCEEASVEMQDEQLTRTPEGQNYIGLLLFKNVP